MAQGLDTSALFEPVQIGGVRLKNRIAMSPMTREFATDGVLPPEAADYYARRAAGGTGLIITEATTIDHEVAHYTTREPYMYGEAQLASWRPVVDAVHAAGGAIFPQLWHTGMARQRSKVHNPGVASVAASPITSGSIAASTDDGSIVEKPGVAPLEATQQDIDAIVAAFGQAAFESQKLGCDGIAIHGAHGYILYQFYSRRSNRRTDAYGGSLQNRARFAIEVVREMRRRTGPDFPIMFRFSQWAGWDYGAKLAGNPKELEELLIPLADAGVDIFDASTRRFWLAEFEGSDLNLAGWAHKLTGKPTMTVGSVGLEAPMGAPGTLTGVTTENLARLVEMVERGDFQIVGVGRALLANPDWADIVREGRWDDLRAYDASRLTDALN
jgi:2,4-dienoyl-CoA reductase-like NADH-dependent reductase (Old Yellow Enzyme family)